MRDKIMAAISLGGYGLAPMLGRIATAWARGEVTDGERDELEAAARDRARPEDSYAPLAERVAALERKVAALEAANAPAPGPDAPDEPAEEWPAYVQPTCAADAYHVGDKVTWGGRRWVCAYEGATWSPGDYPAAWQEWTEAEPGEPEGTGQETETDEGGDA